MTYSVFRILLAGMLVSLIAGVDSRGADLLPIDPLWESASFRKAFTGSYGIDSRIEPKVTTGEKEVLEAVAKELEDKDRDGAAGKIVESSLLNESPALLFALGNLRFEQGKIEDAIENFEAALKLYPNFRDAHRNLAIAEVQRSEFKNAEPHLVRAIELGAQDGLTMGLLGYVHSNAASHQAALQAFRLAQLTMPNETQWKLGEAYALLLLDDPQGAASIYGDVLALQPNEAGLWKNQADAFLQLDETDKGIANLEFARRMGKLAPTEMLSLGHLYLNESMYDLALTRYEEAIQATENPAPAAKAIDALEYLSQVNQWEAVKGMAEKIGATYGEDFTEDAALQSRLTRVQALVELEIGDPEKGAALISGILETNPMDGKAMILLAQFRVRENKPEEATMLLEQAALIPESKAEALLIHGQVLVNLGDYKAALELLEKSQELRPDAGIADYINGLREFAR